MLKRSINGVRTIFSAHNFIRISNFTTKTSNFPHSLVDYLVNSHGFSKEEAITVTASSKVSTFKSTANPNSVVDFLKSNGFSQTQINNVISKLPKILFSNVDKTLKPKIQAFQDFGFSGYDIADILTLQPDVYLRSLNDHIIPTFEWLKSIFGDDNETLLAAVKRSTWLLSARTKKELPGVISLLQSYGLPVCQITKLLGRYPRYLSLGTKVLEPVLVKVEKLGIPRGSGMFFHGLCALGDMSEVNLEIKKGIYKSYGFTDEDVLTLFRKNPYAMRVSESKLRNGLDFFMEEVGYLPSEIAIVPHVLTYSLEKRVIPRYIIWKGLKERGLQTVTKRTAKNIHGPFWCIIKMTEPAFFKKFVQPF